MRVEVDAAAIAANVRVLAARVGVPVCGVVKADGYGHGAVRSARAMLDGGAAMLGVVDLGEAVALRRAGIDAPVLAWLHGPGVDFSIAAANRIDVAVSSIAQLEAAAAAGATVHLKLDTGLGRNGIARGDRTAAIARAIELARGGARIRAVMSHLAGTSRDDDLAQVGDFTAAIAEAADLELELRHLANSQGALALPQARFDMVRIGMAAYGIDPNGPGDGSGSGAAALGLVPAMRVCADFTAGVASIGLDDGLLPAIGAPVVVAGELARVVAIEPRRLRIEPPLTGEGVLWGDPGVPASTLPGASADPALAEPGADAWAVAAGTIGYETVTRMGAVQHGHDRGQGGDAGQGSGEGGLRGQDAAMRSGALAPRRVLELGLDGEPQRLLGEVIGVKHVDAGLGISYGADYVTERQTTLALVGLGYADGVTRAATGRPVVLGGIAHPIRGRVAMDQLVLDIGDRAASVGDPVELAHASAPELTGMIGARVAVELAGSVPDADAMESLGARIGGSLRAGDTVLLIGPLGAGKTTLTRGIGRALGARGTVQSPTFVIARTHRTAAGPDLQHVDAYRLLGDGDDEAELDDLDLDLDGAITVAEWGAPLEHALESWLRVEIARDDVAADDADLESDDESPRTVRLSGRGPAWPAARVRALADAALADAALADAALGDPFPPRGPVATGPRSANGSPNAHATHHSDEEGASA
ncbi:tRNA (adenosine(37)-N6)-threonylcarbamoyltransferase complex ATPase subunit type 1 TsaE [Agrococcus sp. ARC_14]|uniref:tRNA (adenosine(37)-N6)-threonylcarbamoyltransferase complex ATPase subunit type 1 TsaE n=1 Tax=Agrococcus sp. ARC_14 TaxID=2919927 RepID=UPI001F056EB5|nr:tRNA (adenosine(37)-N6)-threonylcarbamoyltransferase complex ATPase subunit type 1 TsaE [Agrococcus sp. ARC_14]MCH1884224.1 tRNA (adenosine(37)-N6)-threonylcarbamoyltransferase complex ATPase subunit type 1 TsaE [Agrococcus sp. ARC_14]